MVSSLRRVLKHQQPAFPRLLPQYSSISGPDPLVFRIGSAETFFQSQTAAGFCGLRLIPGGGGAYVGCVLGYNIIIYIYMYIYDVLLFVCNILYDVIFLIFCTM